MTTISKNDLPLDIELLDVHSRVDLLLLEFLFQELCRQIKFRSSCLSLCKSPLLLQNKLLFLAEIRLGVLLLYLFADNQERNKGLRNRSTD
jgi:hypothetical protein